jgi:hypothetical protein
MILAGIDEAGYARVPEMNANHDLRRSLEETMNKPANLPGRIQP